MDERLVPYRSSVTFIISPPALNLRLRRALSWLGRAERESGKEPPDWDAAFIFHWIAFDAMSSQLGDAKKTDRQRPQYFKRMVAFADASSAIYGAIWSVLQDDIRQILENKYVFQPYWENRNDRRSRGTGDNCSMINSGKWSER